MLHLYEPPTTCVLCAECEVCAGLLCCGDSVFAGGWLAERVIVWKMKKFQGKTELALGIDVALVASTRREKVWSKPPIKMSFQIPMFTSSGIHVRYLKILEKSDYTSTKWIRYLTKTGAYEHRITDGREINVGR